MSPPCTMHCQKKSSQMSLFLPYRVCRALFRRLGALMILWWTFTLTPTFILLLFIPFLTISQYPFYSLVLCSLQMFNPISSSLHLFCSLTWKCRTFLKDLFSFLPSPHSLPLLCMTVGAIKDNGILGNVPNVFVSVLSELSDHLQALSYRGHFSCCLHFKCKVDFVFRLFG